MARSSFIPSGVRRNFLDTKAVRRHVDRRTRRVFARFGYRVRRSARQSIRRRKRSSLPGQPPTDQTGRLKRSIFFHFDPRRRTVVIGAVRFPRSSMAQETLEQGGRVRMKPRLGRRKNIKKIEPRPYMGPAFVKEQPKLPALWREA